MSIITLLTDFGLKDGNVGVMKGVILGLAPDVQIVDISHQISPQHVAEAALILLRSAPYFPDGSIHVVVVDPGVGTARRPIAGRVGNHFFVGPDNGVITLWLERAEQLGLDLQFVHLDKPKYWLPQISHVFHGRDIFAPAGGRLAAGATLSQLGSPIDDVIRLDLPQPKPVGKTWKGEIIHIDHFGNISSNIRQEHLQGQQVVKVRLCEVDIDGFVRTFGDRPPGELIALFGSTGNLIVSVVNGSAAARLNAKVGNLVEAVIE